MGLTFSKVHPGASNARAPMQLNALYKCHYCTSPLLGKPWVLLHPCDHSRFHLTCFYENIIKNAPKRECGMCKANIEAVYVSAPGSGVDGKWFRIVDKDVEGPVQLPLIPVREWDANGKGKVRGEGPSEMGFEKMMKGLKTAVEREEKDSVGLLNVRGRR